MKRRSKTLRVGLAAVMSYFILWGMTVLFGAKQERERAVLLEIQPEIMARAKFGFEKSPAWNVRSRSWCPLVVNVSYFMSWGPLAGVGRKYSVFWFFGFRREFGGSELEA